MQHASEMLKTHPRAPKTQTRGLLECIAACFDCAQTCTTCADACLAEPMVDQLRRCIRLNEDCADMCFTTGRMMSRMTQPDSAVLQTMLEACATVCAACAEECEKHASQHEHCRVCAEACRACETACRDMLSGLGSGTAQAK